MDASQIAALREQLLEQRRELVAQLAQQRGGAIGRAEAAADHFGRPEDSRAQVASEKELEFALDAHETEHLSAIEAALSRMASGTYGACLDCGDDIATARLQAAPEAPRCLACQERMEHQRHPG